MDDGAGVPAEGGLLAGSCHAFYIALPTNFTSYQLDL